MPKIKRSLAAVIFALCFSIFANGQQASPSYGFLEVIDYKNEPVADASVRILSGGNYKDAPTEQAAFTKTDQRGLAEKGIPFFDGNTETPFSVGKTGFYTFIDCFGLFKFLGPSGRSNRENPLKIELLKIPASRAEKKAIGKEQSKREFFLAARRGDAEAVRRFIKSGLTPNLTTSDLRGVPAEKDVPIILFAIASRNFGAVNEFLAAGVDVRRIPGILLSYLDANPYLYNYGESEETTNGKKIYEDNFETLVKKGADVNARGKNRGLAGDEITTLMIAAYHGYPRTVKFLIDRGVPVNAADDLARTALIHAAISPHHKSKAAVVETLLRAGADPNAIAENANPAYSSYCESALMSAVLNGDLETVKTLIKYKADVNLTCRNGNNALKIVHEWKKHGYIKNADEIVKLLEAAGAK